MEMENQFYFLHSKKKYKLSDNELEERPLISRLGLHSASLRFTDLRGEQFFLEAPLPKDMKALLQQLAKNRK
jgi:23S rRNA pseudouridine955/2504/2580 synthase/23S rRNA pseudouridine1911/1915/1917 synthase